MKFLITNLNPLKNQCKDQHDTKLKPYAAMTLSSVLNIYFNTVREYCSCKTTFTPGLNACEHLPHKVVHAVFGARIRLQVEST